jgi:hypothetical protein
MKLSLRNLAFPWIDGLEGIYKPNLVVCPVCGKEFSSEAYKYFGFPEAKHLQIGLVVAVFLFIFSLLSLLLVLVLTNSVRGILAAEDCS